MAKRVGVDKWIFCITLLLVVTGLLMVFSASAVVASARNGSAYDFLVRQSIYAVIGLLVMWALMHVNYRRFNSNRVVFPAIGITVLLLIAAFFAHDSHGAHRWLTLGPLSVEPSELAKPTLILFLAWWLQGRMNSIENVRETILPAVVPSLLFILLIVKEPDLGTAMVCAAVTALMLYLAGMNFKYLWYAALASIVPLYLLLFRVKFRRERILAFLNPDADPLGKGFHIIQSLIAVGSGGLTGVGYMEGRQKLFYLPEPHTDYIFANIAEELGLIGTLCILALFVAFAYRGIRTAIRSRDPFARFLAFGITSMILIQAFFNMSVVIALLPTKGITLPFISYGGTSLIITLALVGVLLNISREIE
jgi:cell division protein FtsW